MDDKSFCEIDNVRMSITSKEIIKLLQGEDSIFEIWFDGEYRSSVLSKFTAVYHPNTNESHEIAVIYRPEWFFECPSCSRRGSHIVIITKKQAILVLCIDDKCNQITWIDVSNEMTSEDIFESFKKDFGPREH